MPDDRQGRVLFGLVSGGVGGGQRVALAVAKLLVRMQVAIAAVAPDDGPALEEFERLGALVHVCGPLRVHSGLKVLQLARLMKRWRVSIVYTHTTPPGEVALASASWLAGARLVLHRHSVGYLSPRPLRKRLQLAFWRFHLRAADEVVCVSRAVQEQVAQVSGRVATVVPNGVPIPQTIPPPQAPPVVAFVGRLDANKRVEDFLLAAARVREHHPGVRFQVVGGGVPGNGYEGRCRALARELGFDERQVFLGSVPRADQFLRDVAILVLPSQLEGHPLVVLEAMALAKAVVVTDIEGCRETVKDGVHGRVVPVGSPPALAEVLADLLDSPSERLRLGNAARELVAREYCEERMLERLLPLLMPRAAEPEPFVLGEHQAPGGGSAGSTIL